MSTKERVSIGFTGTREGMTPEQRSVVVQQVEKLLHDGSEIEAHHGDCCGADAQFHDIVMSRFGKDTRIVIHPPFRSKHRAWKSGEILQTKPYIERNHDIVDAVEILLATPKGLKEELRSGTWATVRYARKMNKPIIIVYPDGTRTRGD